MSDRPVAATTRLRWERFRLAVSEWFWQVRCDAGFCHGCNACEPHGGSDDRSERDKLREIVRLVSEHLADEMQHVPLTPELADAYDAASRSGSSDVGSTTPE